MVAKVLDEIANEEKGFQLVEILGAMNRISEFSVDLGLLTKTYQPIEQLQEFASQKQWRTVELTLPH